MIVGNHVIDYRYIGTSGRSEFSELDFRFHNLSHRSNKMLYIGNAITLE